MDKEWVEQHSEETKVTEQEAKKAREWYMRFLLAGLSGLAAVCYVQPLSFVKIRMQMEGARKPLTKTRPCMLDEITTVVLKDGVIGLYKGFTANLARQVTYTSTRFGVYYMLLDKAEEKGMDPVFHTKCLYGCFAGACAAFLSVPNEVAFVRMIADEKLPFSSRRNYGHVGDALAQILLKEGVSGLWRGTFPTIVKGMLVNSASLGVYSEVKQKIALMKLFKRDPKQRKLVILSSVISGIATALIVGPIDIVKCRLQVMYSLLGLKEYSGMIDCFRKILREEGLLALWKGFTPAFMHSIPYSIFVFLCYEEMSRKYRKSIGSL